MKTVDKIAVTVVVKAYVDIPCTEIKTTDVVTNAFIQQYLKGNFESIDVQSYTIQPKKERCCANCANAEDYSGYEDHHCSYFKSLIRAEHYYCEGFKEK